MTPFVFCIMDQPPQISERYDVDAKHTIDSKCLEPFTYLNQIPGKDIRGLLIDSFQKWLSIPEEKLVAIKEIIASLHNASLLVDDIEDNSKVRRGNPVAHSIYGIAQTINCANYVYFLRYVRKIQFTLYISLYNKFLFVCKCQFGKM